MSANRNLLRNLSIALVGWCAVMAFSIHLIGQPAGKSTPSHHVGLVDDWSTHHMVFSNPGTIDQVKSDSEAYSRWYGIQYNNRFIMQNMRRRGFASNSPAAPSSAPEVSPFAGSLLGSRSLNLLGNPFIPAETSNVSRLKNGRTVGLGGLWNSPLLTGAVMPNTFPAKYTFDPIGNPDCTNDYVAYPVGSAGTNAVAASITGTFSGMSATGTAVVDGVTLTASPGGAATQSTTINSNGFASNDTITISSTLTGTLTLTASPPIAEKDQLAVSATGSNGAEVAIAGIEYEFVTTITAPPSGFCYISSGASLLNRVAYLAAAIGFTGTGGSGTTWECNAGAQQPSSGVTVTSSTSPDVDVTAKIPGSTGITPTTGGTNPPVVSVLTNGADYTSNVAPNFQFWSGAAVISSASTLATNIFDAMAGNTHNVTGGNPSNGVVTITAALTGTAGNSITVSTTSTTADLSGAKFTGSLSGGTAGTTSGLTFKTSTDLNSTLALNEAAEATNLATAINNNVSAVTAGGSGAVVTVTDNTAGAAGNSIGTTDTMAVFAWADTTLDNGADPGATIIAYNNLYTTTCTTGTVPNVDWAYNTGTGYTVTTSPTLSMDGTEVAFVQDNGSTSQLVVLKPSASGGSASSATLPTPSSNISTCSAPCMTVTTLTGSSSDTYSSPFYDYNGSNALFVGDDASHLFKVSGIFNTTSSPTFASVTLGGSAYTVASPVFEPVSGCVFVGDSQGYFYSVSSGIAGSVCTGATYANFGHSTILSPGVANEGIFDGPLVDSSSQMVYAFVTDSKALTHCASGNNCIVQFATGTITSGSTTASPANDEPLGTGAANYNLYAGSPDNVYYSSTGGTAGDIWVVGNTGNATNGSAGANLYRVPIGTGSAMSSPVAAISGLTDQSTTPTAHHPFPSPITEFCNNGANPCTASGTMTTAGTDYIFFSVDRLVTATGTCLTGSGDGCVLGYSINTPTGTPINTGGLAVTAVGSPGCWSTSGFVIDNASASTGASQLYFMKMNGNSPATTPGTCTSGSGNTIQASQASQAHLN